MYKQQLIFTVGRFSQMTGMCVERSRDNSLVVCWTTKTFLLIAEIFSVSVQHPWNNINIHI